MNTLPKTTIVSIVAAAVSCVATLLSVACLVVCGFAVSAAQSHADKAASMQPEIVAIQRRLAGHDRDVENAHEHISSLWRAMSK